MSWLYFSKFNFIIWGIFTYLIFVWFQNTIYYRAVQSGYRYTRAYNRRQLLPYDDIWETRATGLNQQYYDYYTYIWYNWHEMEERLVILLAIRAVIFGI